MDHSQTSKPGTGPAEFTVTTHNQASGVALLKVTGEVDVYTSPRLRSAMLEVFEAGSSSIVVDLTAVDYLDSSGLGILVAGLKRAREQGGELYLVSTKPRIMRVLEVTGLDKVFGILTSQADAIAAAERK